MQNANTNREYKDTVFTKLFSDKGRLVELYNAIDDVHYAVSDGITINTLENVLFMGRRNDISFTIADKLVVLMEHQSTINDNMPLRFLEYIARLYEGIVDDEAVYKRNRLTIPRPEFIVLYNGVTSLKADDYYIKLSEMFAKDETRKDTHNFLELEARVLNVNKGHNRKVLRASGTLGDYAEFVEVVRQETKGIDSEDKVALASAMERAIRICIERGILKDFLYKHSREVMNMGMLTSEFDINVAKRVWREEAFDEGMLIGMQKGEQKGKQEGKQEGERTKTLETARNFLALGMPLDTISKGTGLSLAKLKELQNDIIV
ncbi:Rpn family recombination-promoting nuclease/putative transposase [Deferribacterales bacterium RsTz2092]